MKKNNNESDPKVPFLPIGMCIGISIGMAIGAATDNIPVFMCIGLSIGMCIGTLIDNSNAKKADNSAANENGEKCGSDAPDGDSESDTE